MGRVGARGYPVPHVYEVHDDALVMEYVDGATMAADLRRRPWRLARHMRTLAELHDRLHRLGVVHLDLHPENVLLGPDGPVVIDWTNAREDGDPAMDDALSWLILRVDAGTIPARLFARHLDVRTGLKQAGAFRLADRNLTPPERDRTRAVLARAGCSLE
jgi:serine/threonine-protein kinase RIO1